mgnify:CR=1 FL=1
MPQDGQNVQKPAEQRCCHCGAQKHTPRSEQLKADVTRRLNRAIGQLNGIKTMVEEDRYCIDISNQIMATQSILTKANAAILQAHMSCCVREAAESGDADEKLEEISKLLQKLLK